MGLITVTEKDGYTELGFSGKVAGITISKIKEELRSFGYNQDVVLDMADVEMIDSVGIGLCMTIYNELTKKGNFLKMVNLSDDIYDLFSVMNISKHFDVLKK